GGPGPGVCLNHACEFDRDLSSGADLSGIDLSMPGADLAGIDFAGADLTQPAQPDLASSDLARGVCDYPQLLVTVENLGAPGPGKVLRYHIPALGPPTACSPLNGSGALGQFPQAAAKGGDNIAV